ncbi:MAG: flagellar motor protein MotB [Pseudomonadota bacterium]
MSVQGNVAPVIIKRKKVVGGDGHHGGAWKVAYADFVTAMMAFFMLMWLLNATTEQQRKGIADYFSPTIPINRVSGGGDGAFGGTSVFSEEALPQNGTGATSLRPTASNKASGAAGQDGQDDPLTSVEAELLGRGGESAVMENALKHIITRVTDEGLVIEIFSREGALIFDPETGRATPLLANISAIVGDVARTVTNPIAVEAHVPARPVVLSGRDPWADSVGRAEQMRALLEATQIRPQRISRVTGHADREPVSRNPMALRNARVEIILLR